MSPISLNTAARLCALDELRRRPAEDAAPAAPAPVPAPGIEGTDVGGAPLQPGHFGPPAHDSYSWGAHQLGTM